MDDKRIKKNQRAKKIIGILLLIAIAYFVLTNFDFPGWPRFGVLMDGPKTTCTEIRGPKMMTDTVVEKLQVRDAGFKAVSDERRAELTVENIDNVSGEVRVMLFCRDGEQQGEQKKRVQAHLDRKQKKKEEQEMKLKEKSQQVQAEAKNIDQADAASTV
jgi:hypothetical protein